MGPEEGDGKSPAHSMETDAEIQKEIAEILSKHELLSGCVKDDTSETLRVAVTMRNRRRPEPERALLPVPILRWW